MELNAHAILEGGMTDLTTASGNYREHVGIRDFAEFGVVLGVVYPTLSPLQSQEPTPGCDVPAGTHTRVSSHA